MQNPTDEVFEQAWQLDQDGVSMKEILVTTGLNLSQAWLYITDRNLPKGKRIKEASPEAVATARAEGDSWGMIAVRCGLPEGQVRKLFSEATGLKSKGQRIGKGGRFAYGDARYYQGENSKVGISIPKDLKMRPPLPGESDHLKAMSFKELKALAEERGVKPAGKLTKGNLIVALS